MRTRNIWIILTVGFLIGISVLLYPAFSNYWNSLRNSKAVASYVQEVANLKEEEYDAILSNAIAYNEELRNQSQHYALSDEQMEVYKSVLDPTGTGIMGYIEIPSIQVSLPIYHTTSNAVLQKAVGHLEWSSLPVGGEGSHCVVSGHRGLPSARLFTDLDKVSEGDTFTLHILNEVLTYEVREILTVEPDDVQALSIFPEEDLCTLVTCTPYGINSHRLLIKGYRIETPEEALKIRVTADALQIEPIIVAPIVATPILLSLLILLLVKPSKKEE